MMRKLDWYIARNVLAAIGIVMLIVMGLDLLQALIDELDRVNDRYTYFEVGRYLLLTIPRRFYEMLPLSSLVGCLIGLGTLASQSELTVMRASGFSTQRIVLAVFKPVLLLMVLELITGQFIAPITEQMAVGNRAVALSQDGILRADVGAWHREGNDFIHIAAVERGGVVHGVTRYAFDDQQNLVSSSYARLGEANGDGWLLKDVSQTRFVDGHTVSKHLDSQQWNTALTPRLLEVIIVDPTDLSMTGLWSYAHYLAKQGIDPDTYLLAFWGKVLQPLSIGALVLIGVSFIFGPLRNVTAGQRVIAGVIVGVAFKFAQDMLGPASSVFGFSPLVAVLLPILLCLGAGIVLLKRAG